MFNVGAGEIIVIAVIALIFQREVQQAFEEHGGAQAVQAADKLKTLTGGPLGPVRTGVNAAVASVSSQARLAAPAEKRAKNATKKAPTKRSSTAKKTAPTKRGPAKKAAPAKKSAPAKRTAPAGAAAKRKAPAKPATPAKKP
jgi:hypothetical protein